MITHQGCGKWLKRFWDGEKDVDDLEKLRSGRPSNFDEDELRRNRWDLYGITFKQLERSTNSAFGYRTSFLISTNRHGLSEEVKESIQQWIDSKPTGFWVKGITALLDRWAKTIEFKENYFPED
uniref:Transposase n=1 Tax=Acrobeloides nanus TaxID=290746 RepID=A0A914E059_9BILA